jgi:hypothetical protein
MPIQLTVDELVAHLQRSELVTVLVEGKDDMTIYRWMEDAIGTTQANFLPCGGRTQLLEVFARRTEFPKVKTLFLADKDTFVYTAVPEMYRDIIWTSGYSIENDLYHGKAIERLLSSTEDPQFRKALANFIDYYAFEVEKVMSGKSYDLSTHPNEMLNDGHELNATFLTSRGYLTPSAAIVAYLHSDYDLLIRGKSLFALLLRFLSDTKRETKHSKKSLLETCYKLQPNETIKLLENAIRDRLSEKES